ncbi:MAG TPA: bZIP transcription factor [Nannocystis sp.]|jgi:hypothetical protein
MASVVLPLTLWVAPAVVPAPAEPAPPLMPAEPAPAEPTPVPAPVVAADPASERLDRLERRLKALERENRGLRDEVTMLREDHDEVSERVDRVMPLTGRVGGYLDVGFFYGMGDGSGIRPDIGYQNFPEYEGVVPDSWVFMGDPLSTTINSRGEPADTGASRAISFDGVNSQGKSSFILNAFNLNLLAGIGKGVSIEGLIDFVPRARNVADPDTSRFALGDYIDVKLGYLRWQVPVKRLDFDLYAGKIDPPFGYEYRIQESPSRIGVTPSLICRYTCGRPLGIKARFRFLPRRSLIFAMSVTNGGSFTENFGFANEIDTNHFKTVMGRLSYVIPVGSGLEIGASGAVGAQDFQPKDLVIQKQYGFDLHLEAKGVDLTGEFVMGKVDGDTEAGGVRCGIAPCLDFRGAYGLLGYRVLTWLMPYARVDWRKAVHQSGASFVYNSNTLRITPGLRFEVGTNVIIKLEYSVNRELGRVPGIRNDVFTSSLVARM